MNSSNFFAGCKKCFSSYFSLKALLSLSLVLVMMAASIVPVIAVATDSEQEESIVVTEDSEQADSEQIVIIDSEQIDSEQEESIVVVEDSQQEDSQQVSDSRQASIVEISSTLIDVISELTQGSRADIEILQSYSVDAYDWGDIIDALDSAEVGDEIIISLQSDIPAESAETQLGRSAARSGVAEAYIPEGVAVVLAGPTSGYVEIQPFNVVNPPAPGTGRHFTVSGGLRTEGNVILCGGSMGTIFRIEYFFPFNSWADSLNPGEPGANNSAPPGGNRLVNTPQMGGGVAVTGGTFDLTAGGVIRRSVANYGGAVEVTGTGVFNLRGGTIGGEAVADGNAAIRHGGGISANGPNARVNIYAGEVRRNRVVGKISYAPVPPPHYQVRYANNWTWPTSGTGAATVRLEFPRRYDFPHGESRGGGGIAIRGGSRLVIRDNMRAAFTPAQQPPTNQGTAIAAAGSVAIAHNFAERGGGIYVYGPNSSVLLDHRGLVIRDNVTRHSYTRPAPSGAPSIVKPATPPHGSTVPAAQWPNITFNPTHPDDPPGPRSWPPTGWRHTAWNLQGAPTSMTGTWPPAPPTNPPAPLDAIPWPNNTYSGGGAGIHVRGGITGTNAARVDMLAGQITRNVATAATGGGGGGVFVGTRGEFNHFGGMIGGADLNASNRLSPFANQNRATGGDTGSGVGVAVVSTSTVAGNQARFNMGRANNTVTTDDPAHIRNNQRMAWGHGAGLAVLGNGIATMRHNAEISHNVGTTNGGAFINGGTLHMHYNSVISHNRTDNGTASAGGGIHMQGAFSSVTMNNTARIHSNRYNFNSTAANPGTHAGAGVNMTGGTFTMNNTSSIDNNRATSLGGGVSITSGTFNMNDNSVIRNNTAANTGTVGNAGGGVRMAGGVFNMGRQGTAADAPRIDTNSAGNAGGAGPAQRDGGGVFMTGGTFNMWAQSVIGSDVAANRNFAGRNGGGVLMQGATAEFIMNQNASIRGNTATINGGGLHLSDSTRFTMNGSGSTIHNNTATGTTAAANDGHGGGIFVASNRIGANPLHGAAAATANTTGYGVRINAGTISNNNAPTGDGGAIFSSRYTYRSPLVGNPLLDSPFVDTNIATNVSHRYNNLNISNAAVFSGNVSRQWSYPPIGPHLPNVAWNAATGSSVSRAASPLYLLNNHDINFRWAGHDFWFIKEDASGNPLSGVTFTLQRGTGALTTDISRANGLVGFPRVVGPLQENIANAPLGTGRGPTVGAGAANTYTLRETAVPANMNIVLPAGRWTFTLPDNRRTEIAAIQSHGPAANPTLLNPAFSRTERASADPNVFTAMAWRVYNTIIQPASLSFFKTDMSIYDSSFTGSHPRFAGAEFRLYKYTPQSASTQFSAAVPQPLPTSGQPGFGYWTLITGNLPNGNISDTALSYTLNFYRNQPTDWFNTDGSPAIFHLLEMETPAATQDAPDGFVRPTGQWRFTLTPLSTGDADISVALAPGSTNPAFVWVGAANTGAWYVGNEPYEPLMIPTGLALQSSAFVVVPVVAISALGAGVFAVVKFRRKLELFAFRSWL